MWISPRGRLSTMRPYASIPIGLRPKRTPSWPPRRGVPQTSRGGNIPPVPSSWPRTPPSCGTDSSGGSSTTVTLRAAEGQLTELPLQFFQELLEAGKVTVPHGPDPHGLAPRHPEAQRLVREASPHALDVAHA